VQGDAGGGRDLGAGQLQPGHHYDDEDIADTVYIEPLTVEMVARIIERERPDGLLPTLGARQGSTWR